MVVVEFMAIGITHQDNLISLVVFPLLLSWLIANNTFERDTGPKGEGRQPDVVIHIDGLNEAAIKQWWESYRQSLTFNSTKKNCSHVALEALTRGTYGAKILKSPPPPVSLLRVLQM